MATTSVSRRPEENIMMGNQRPVNGMADPRPVERRQSSKRAAHSRYPDTAAVLPVAPEAPRPPPSSMRNSYSGPPLSRHAPGARSFAERAKNLPPERGLDMLDLDGSAAWVESQRWLNNSKEPPKPTHQQENIHPASPTTPADVPMESAPVPRASQEASPLSRSDTTRSRREQQSQREWAPGRSPLQKLEFTLKDITKEEKRARVEEAEMLLREARAGRRSGRISRDMGPSATRRNTETRKTTAPGPTSLEEAGLVRSLSGKQRDQLQRSAVIESKKPSTQQASKEDRSGFEYEEQQHRPVDTSASPERMVEPEPIRVPFNQFEAPPVAPAPRSIPKQPITRSTSESARPPPQRNYSMDSYGRNGPVDQAPPIQRGHTRRPSAAATYNAPTTNVQRSNSRKLQKPMPRDLNTQLLVEEYRRQPNGNQSPHAPMSRPPIAEPPRSLEQPQPKPNAKALDKLGISTESQNFGLGLQNTFDSSPQDTLQSPPEQPRSGDSGSGKGNGAAKPKQHSVSFAVPPPTPPPLSEWKNAVVGRLNASDFDLREVGLHRAWWEGGGSGKKRRSKEVANEGPRQPKISAKRNAPFQPPLYLQCGPLLRYTGMKRQRVDSASGPVEKEFWRGSIMIVTKDSASSYETPPRLRVFSQPMGLFPAPSVDDDDDGDGSAPEYVDPVAGATKIGRNGRLLYVKQIDHLESGVDLSYIEDDTGLFETSPSPPDNYGEGRKAPQLPETRIYEKDGETVGKYKEIDGVRLYADPDRGVTFWRFNLEIELGAREERVAYRINGGSATGFWVPAKGQSMNMMFHSGNGFSPSVDRNKFNGPEPLWRDVLNAHQSRPFHVMIGGGEQIHGDAALVETTYFQDWMKLRVPYEKRQHPFNIDIKSEVETFYLEHYLKWFSQGLFSMANSQIPMVNMWNSHDVISRYGSYAHPFMKTPVFSGVGNVAFKYYMLFQHQSVPEETHADEPSWLLGAAPGPYIQEKSRNLFMHLSRRVAFLGLDCRTERTKDDILQDDSYDLIWNRCYNEIIKGETKHLIVLVGVPVAYPRLVWLQNVMTSRLMDPVKAIGRARMFGNLGSKFEIDTETLDDQWTAKAHKLERRWLIEDLQELAAEKSVRVTILSGDVHMAGIGQFYSNPKLQVAKDKDYRYIPNIISSGIASAPASDMIADALNQRNKTHFLDINTVEDMRSMFPDDVNGRSRNNKRLLPRRNWCAIREYAPGTTPPQTPSEESTPETPPAQTPGKLTRSFSLSQRDGGASKLMRRFSLRGPPPSRHPSAPGPDRRRMSYDGIGPSGVRDSYFPPQQSPATADPSHQPPFGQSEPQPGTFMRRRTDLSAKELKRSEKQGLTQNHFLNLEGGLDITLNCEVNARDPTGTTTPYRILVPSLWFDGKFEPLVQQKKRRWWSMGRKKREPSDEDFGDGDEEDEEYEDAYPEPEELNMQDQNGPMTPPMPQSHPGHGPGPAPMAQGYGGVEAHKPKKKWFGIV